MSSSTAKTRKEMEAEVIEKANSDATFRQQLIDDPKAAIKEHWDVAIPDGIDVKVIEETSTSLCLVLPLRASEEARRELSVEELDMVAGGEIDHAQLAQVL